MCIALPVRPGAPPDAARYGLTETKLEILMATLFNVFAIVVMIAVVFVLLRGLMNMMRGGSGNTSNKLMQMRVALQAVALVLILLALYFGGRHG